MDLLHEPLHARMTGTSRGAGQLDAEADTRADAGSAPQGLRWRLTGSFTTRSRERRLEQFMQLMSPRPGQTLLDVGVNDTAWRASNFLEAGYPWPECITAVGVSPMPTFQRLFPQVRFVVADGRALPFADGTFDIGFSNAVVEHVGSTDDQRQFVAELLRTCRRVFIATPNASFPIDPHTLLPFVHWLPRRLRHPILHATRNGRWASEAALHPLSARALQALFPADAQVRVVRQRVLGFTTVLLAVAGRTEPGERAP